jgi:hypothetical protein
VVAGAEPVCAKCRAPQVSVPAHGEMAGRLPLDAAGRRVLASQPFALPCCGFPRVGPTTAVPARPAVVVKPGRFSNFLSGADLVPSVTNTFRCLTGRVLKITRR